MTEEWSDLLARARVHLGMSQTQLAVRSQVSLASIKAYETAQRHPSRPYLVAILDALKLDRTERTAILEAAGYASDWRSLTPSSATLAFTLETAQTEVDRAKWPAFVMNEMSEVLVANRDVQKLWGVDLRVEYTDVGDRSLLAVASNPRFADKCANWDEAVGTLVAVFKGHHRGPESLDDPSPQFRSVIERFLQGDPRYVTRFLKLWEEVPARTPELRWHYPVVWEQPGVGTMSFDCLVSSANERDGWSFNDWVPFGANSWAALERMRAH